MKNNKDLNIQSAPLTCYRNMASIKLILITDYSYLDAHQPLVVLAAGLHGQLGLGVHDGIGQGVPLICWGAEHPWHPAGGSVGRRLQAGALAAAEELHDGHNNGQEQTSNEDVVDPGHVAEGQLVGCGGLLVVQVEGTLGFVVPPFVSNAQELAVFFQCQHSLIKSLSEWC